MFLIIGLGNPGIEYQKTRHNVGFMVLDEFVSLRDISRRETREYSFPAFKLSKKHGALISEGTIRSAKVMLAKPQTFMNNSGKAVQSLLPKFGLGKTKPGLVVIHDDIDIALGKVKISKGSGSAGHKGVGSIIQSLGTKDFTRIRIGIQPATGKPENIEAFVLRNFTTQETPPLKQATAEALTILNTTILRSMTV